MISGKRCFYKVIFTSVLIVFIEMNALALTPNYNLQKVLSQITVTDAIFNNISFLASPIQEAILLNLAADNRLHQIHGMITTNTTEMYVGNTMWERVMNFYRDGGLAVHVLVIIIGVLIFSLFSLFITIIINRIWKTTKRGEIEKLKLLYQEQLAAYLFDEEIEQVEFKDMQNQFYRQIFTDVLMDFHSNLHGETADKLRNLYFNLELHKDSIDKIKNSNWHIKAKGFREVAQLDVKEAAPLLRKFINAKNPILRIDAQVAMVKLSDDNPLGFLNNIDYELSYWEQINIYDTLLYHQINVDSFEPFLNNPNPSVVVFAVRMIGYFKHVDAAEKVKNLFNDNSHEVRLAAVKTIGEFEDPLHNEALRTLFLKETESLNNQMQDKERPKRGNGKQLESLDDLPHRKIRHAILEVLHASASADDIPFLRSLAVESENSNRVKIHALSILNSLQPEGKVVLKELSENGDAELKKIIDVIIENQ